MFRSRARNPVQLSRESGGSDPGDAQAPRSRLREKLRGLPLADQQAVVAPKDDLRSGVEAGIGTKTSGGQVTAKELRSLFDSTIFPTVKSAVEADGLSVDARSCDLCSAFTMIVLDELGIGGASLRDAGNHICVQVETSDDQTLILDVTMAQFFVNETGVDDELQGGGFIGTEDELAAMLIEHIEAWDFHGAMPSIPSDLLAAFRNAAPGALPDDDQKAIDALVGTYLEAAMENFVKTENPDKPLSDNANRIRELHKSRGAGGAHGKAFKALDQALQGRRPKG